MDDGSSTGNLITSLPVAVALNKVNKLVRGSDSFDKSTAPVLTGNAIRWDFDNINVVPGTMPNVKFIQPYIIKNSGNAELGLKLSKIEIQAEVDPITRSLSITYEGMEGEALADINEIFNGNLVYSRAKAIEQFDDKLYLANLETDPIFRYQQFANAIVLEPVMEDICNFDPRQTLNMTTCVHNNPDPWAPGGVNKNLMNRNSYRNSQYYVGKRGYKRGETYAFYIAFIKSDGSMSPAYHIPGRWPINQLPLTVSASSYVGPENVVPNFYHQPGWILPGSNGMNFWRNQDEVYPDNADFDTTDIVSGTAVTGPTNRDMFVRHHHFPHGHDVEWGSYYTGTSPWAVVQNAGNTNNPALGSLNATWTNQMYGSAYDWVDIISGTQYSVGGTTTTINLAIIVNLNAWSMLFGDPNIFQTGVNVNVWGMTHQGINIMTTAGAAITGLITNRIDNYLGNPNHVYMQFQVTVLNTDILVNTHWTSAAQVPDSSTSWLVTDDNGIWSPIGFNSGSASEDFSWMNDFDTCPDGACYNTAVNILGFRLKNLAVPREISDNAQGFRIYRAQRREADRTRVDQGLAANIGNETVRLDSKRSKVTALFQVPFYGIDGMGYRRNAPGDHENVFDGHFGFYGFESLRSRKSLNEVTDIDQIYALNEASVTSLRGPEIHVPSQGGNIDFQNDNVNTPAYLTDNGSEVTCYDPWREGFIMNISSIAFNGQMGWYDTWNSGAGCTACWPANGDTGGGYVGGPSIYTGVYHFLSIYDQMWNAGASHMSLGNKLEYIQGNTIESLRDHHNYDYAYNMGGTSYVLGEGFGGSTYKSGIVYYDDGGTNPIPSTSNPGSMYVNYTGNQITGAQIDYATAAGNEVDELLPDNIGNAQQSHFRVIDLYSRKRNVYNDFDTQNLVWTGFEVLGEEFNRFIVDLDAGTPSSAHTQDSYPLLNETDKIFGGDTFIVRDDVRITFDGYDLTSPTKLNHLFQGSALPLSIYGMGANIVHHTTGMHAALVSTIIESNENIVLRHANTPHTVFSPDSSIHKILFSLDGICVGLGSSCYTNNDWLGDDAAFVHVWNQDPCLPTDLLNHKTGTNANGEEGIRYNDIYHYSSLLGNPIPVSNSIEEILTYPVRVTRSITGGGVSDTYRNFPELDFMDVQTDKGSIWNLFIHTGVLMIQSEDGLYKTKGSETLNTEQGGDIYVGTGNIFANTPELVATANLGVGGTTLRFSNYSTKWGYYYIDYNRRTINHFGETLTIISDKGLREWMQLNIPIQLYDFGVPQDLELTNTLFGFSLGLDARHNRLLITKRSYTVTATFLASWNTNASGTGTDIRWNNTEFRFEEWNGSTWAIVNFTNTAYFEEDNWTLSYYPEEQIWGSFHTYWPSSYICHDDEIYGYGKSPGFTGVLWRHNSRDFNNFGRYYLNAGVGGTRDTWPFEVMQSFNKENLSTKAFYALNVDTKWTNQQGAVEHNIGLTHYYAHTDIQTTGMRELNYMETYRGVGSSWQINDLRDRALLSNQDLRVYDGGGTQLTPVNLYGQPMFLPGSTTELNPLYIAVGAAVSAPIPLIQPGLNYTPGTTLNYFPTSITPGSVGTGLDVTFTINGAGQLIFVQINDGGSGYVDGEVFSIPGIAQNPVSSGIGAFFTIEIDKPWHQMRRINDRYINIFLRDDNSVKYSLTLLDSSVLYKSYSR